MIITTERLILRPWDESDAENLYQYAKDPAIGPIAGWQVHTSAENSLKIIKTVLSANETYAVCLKSDNKAIGSIGLIPPAQSNTKTSETEFEIGYWIGVPFWGNGYIPEAVQALLQHAFLNLNCTAMWCGYYDGNIKSKKCQEKSGFKYHHTEENKPCILMNDIRTEHFTYLSKEEWMKHNPVNSNIYYRKIENNEYSEALNLVWNVFMEYEAPEYSQEGIKEFYKSIHDDKYLSGLCVYGAFIQDELVGVIASRSSGTHIALFFVSGKHHRKGIGKTLFYMMKSKCKDDKITVNSSPYAVPVYRKLGFKETDKEQIVSGLRFTPMEYHF